MRTWLTQGVHPLRPEDPDLDRILADPAIAVLWCCSKRKWLEVAERLVRLAL